jgi:predicted transcriptional regulator
MQYKIYSKNKFIKVTWSTSSLLNLNVLGFKNMSNICKILIYVISSTPASIADPLPSLSIASIVIIAPYVI